MKRTFCMLFVVVLVALLPMRVGAEEIEPTATTPMENMEETITTPETTFETTVETEAATLTLGEIADAEVDRSWILGIIENAAPQDVEKMQSAIENAILDLETQDFGEWDWLYKIVKDNAGDLAAILVGLGMLAVAIVGLVQIKSKKMLNSNLVISTKKAVEISNANKKALTDFAEQLSDVCAKVTALMAETSAKDQTIATQTHELEHLTLQEIQEHHACTEANILLADIVFELLELSNIPQIKKDALFSRYETAKKKIGEAGAGHAETKS